MKIGFFTDTHIRADTPEGRTDDYRKAIFTKLEEIGSIFQDTEYVLFGGDLFNTPDPSNSIINDTIQMFKSWKKEIIGVVGSHDYFGYQMKSLKRTGIGILYRAGVISLVGKEEELTPRVDIHHRGGIGYPIVAVTGNSHSYWLADDPKNFFGDSEGGFHIQLVHGDLVDKPVLWPHVTVDQVTTEADVVLSGHYHPGWSKPITLGGTTFINPGSIGRLENTGRQRIPRVCIIDVNYGEDVNVNTFTSKFVELTTAEKHPFKEKVAKEEVQQDITKLLSLMENTEIDVIDIKQQLPLAAERLGFSKDVVEKAFDILERVISKNKIKGE